MNQVKADLLNKVNAYFLSLGVKLQSKNICVCLSGGADSVALLHALLHASECFGFSVSACHFNHMIRGEESDQDEEFCKALCKRLSVKIYCGRDDVPANARYYKISLEEAARNCRYAFFERVSSKENVDFCATAHNMNDDAETLLFNLIRGSGSNGASSISPKSGKLLRPFLKVKREEIEAFLSDLGQPFVTDSTNASVEYTRNYIRKVVIPEIQNINPSVVDSLSRYIESCRVDRDYFDLLVEKHLDSDLLALHKAVRSRVLLRKYKDVTGSILNSSMLNELEKALNEEKRCIISINTEYEAIVSNGKVDFYKKSDNDFQNFDVQSLSIGENSVFGERVNIEISENKPEQRKIFNKISISDLLSFDNIIGGIRVRTRRTGDKICIHGVNKSLKKLFIEKKIPKEYRNIIPIIFDEAGILYVPFVGIADRAYFKDFNKRLYIITSFNTIDKERWNNAYEQK